jgi:hypothetical protein
VVPRRTRARRRARTAAPQRERAAKAEKQRREAAEQQLLDEQWKRSEWFRKRKREMKKLASQWDEAASTDGR